ncbi:hypothetical protein BJV77DRAFT_539475 [Russula vinacea]|nr:hypothetical protein BJV77DRAFT_539475 [Russula vinacea]
MSLLQVAAPFTSLFFFSAFSIAQVFAPNCTSATWQWTFNSLTQSPCTVIVNMMATCSGGKYSLSPLLPGSVYYGPYRTGDADTDLCYCNTVGYSLFSACGACQGHQWITWSEWVTNCTNTLPPPSFPNPVPSGFFVPQWALLDVTNENNWNLNESYSVGDTPEAGPGSLIGPSESGVSNVSATPTSYFDPSSTGPPPPFPGGGGPNGLAIAGGVIGGFAGIAIVIAVISRLQRSSLAPSSVSAGVGASLSQQPSSSDVVPPPSSGSSTTMELQDPNDPTTFSGYQGNPQSPDIASQAPLSSNIGPGSTLGNTQTSLPQAVGHHGHSTVGHHGHPTMGHHGHLAMGDHMHHSHPAVQQLSMPVMGP